MTEDSAITRELNDTPQEQVEKALWYMHVSGPDDVHAVPDFWTGLAWAAELNAFVAARAAKEKWAADENWPLTQATVRRWTWTPEQHATLLARELSERQEHAAKRAAALADTIRGLVDRASSGPTFDPNLRVGAQVWAAARDLTEEQRAQPNWLWHEGGKAVSCYGLWPKGATGMAPYVRADIALGIAGAAAQKQAAQLSAVTVPAPNTEERHFWLEAAAQHGFESTSGEEELPAFDPPAYLATEDEVLKLMAASREQGRKDVIDALATGGSRG